MPLLSSRLLGTLVLFASLAVAAPAPGLAQDAEGIAETLPERVLFVTSGGYWDDVARAADAGAGTASGDAAEGGDPEASSSQEMRRGHYRLIIVRGEDNRSLAELQRIELAADGPVLDISMSLEEINDIGAYVTDVRPENSTGAASQPGFAAFIYLKTDPSVSEPETWTVFVDEFGDVVVEQSSN